jgi:hypothetical protein
MPAAEAASYRFNPFDLTKAWYYKDYPLITIGKLTLNRNPDNYFAEVEQAAFNPANFVPGIGPSPDERAWLHSWCPADAPRSPAPAMPVRKYYSARRRHLPLDRTEQCCGVSLSTLTREDRHMATPGQPTSYNPNTANSPITIACSAPPTRCRTASSVSPPAPSTAGSPPIPTSPTRYIEAATVSLAAQKSMKDAPLEWRAPS